MAQNKESANAIISTIKARVEANAVYFMNADEVRELFQYIVAAQALRSGNDSVQGTYTDARVDADLDADAAYALTAAALTRQV